MEFNKTNRLQPRNYQSSDNVYSVYMRMIHVSVWAGVVDIIIIIINKGR